MSGMDTIPDPWLSARMGETQKPVDDLWITVHPKWREPAHRERLAFLIELLREEPAPE